MSYASASNREIAKLGEEIFARDIRPCLDSSSHGQYVVLDVETGQFEIDSDDLTATKKLLTRLPQAKTYGVRIGYAAAYRLSGLTRADS